MSRSAAARRVGGICALLATLGGCDGSVIRLGAGPADGGSCTRAPTAAAVLWIGDSWVLVPGNQHTTVRDRARASGAIGATDDYTIDAAAGADFATVANQYATREASASKPEVLIMDGGTWDTLTNNGSTASVNAVVAGFGAFLDKVAADGTVRQITYFLPPELPTIAGVAALRTPLRQACAASAVPCHFIDLQALWTGHSEYTGADNLLPSAAGAAAIADAIWSVMQASCPGN